MGKIKFAWVLPVVNLSLVLALWVYDMRTPLPNWDTGYTSTPMMIGYGISAPALIFKFLSLPFRWTGLWPVSIGRFDLNDLLFFLGVVVTWFLVGSALDRRASRRALVQSGLGFGMILWDLALVALGVFFFAASLEDTLMPWTRGTVGHFTDRILFFAWGVVLVILPSTDLANAIRRRFQAQPTS